MNKYNGLLETKFWWILPGLLGISKSTITKKIGFMKKSKYLVYALHLTPFIEIGFNWKKKKS